MADPTLMRSLNAALAKVTTGHTTLEEIETVVQRAFSDGALSADEVQAFWRDAERDQAISQHTILRGLADTAELTDASEVFTAAVATDATRMRPPKSPSTDASVPEDPPNPTDGSQSLLGGRYRLERKLGSGGMGTVYLASDQEVRGELFAVKLLNAEVRGLADAMDLMREEVRKTRALAHPNIVGVYSLNRDGANAFILMEYLEGKTLDSLLDHDFGRGIPMDRAWPIIEDICRALGHAHNHSVIHSDLKPSNVFVTTSGKTKLVDFGIARAARHRTQIIDPGDFDALTPAYASPEMLRGTEPDQRDDVYSLGCVIYEMLSGRHPFGRTPATDAERQGLTVASLPMLSRAQNAALAKSLSFHRQDRTESVEIILHALSPAGAQRDRRRQMLIWAVTAALGVAVAATVGWRLWPRSGAPDDSSPVSHLAVDTGHGVAPPQTGNGASTPLPSQSTPLPLQATALAATARRDDNACHAVLSREALDKALSEGLDASVGVGLYAAGSRDANTAQQRLQDSLACLRTLKAVGISSADSERFLRQE